MVRFDPKMDSMKAAADPAPPGDDMDEAARKLDAALGEASRIERAIKGRMSQETLAEASGLSKRTIGRIENGSSMTLPQMLKISIALGVTPGELLSKAEALGE